MTILTYMIGIIVGSIICVKILDYYEKDDNY